MSSPIASVPDPCSKSCDDDALLHWVAIFEERGDLERLRVALPVPPVLCPSRGGFVNDAMGYGMPRRQDIASNLNLLGTLYSVQEKPCGRGNRFEKVVRNDL